MKSQALQIYRPDRVASLNSTSGGASEFEGSPLNRAKDGLPPAIRVKAYGV
jgi:hypothetical protein